MPIPTPAWSRMSIAASCEDKGNLGDQTRITKEKSTQHISVDSRVFAGLSRAIGSDTTKSLDGQLMMRCASPCSSLSVASGAAVWYKQRARPVCASAMWDEVNEIKHGGITVVEASHRLMIDSAFYQAACLRFAVL